jgi:hypothetical protein
MVQELEMDLTCPEEIFQAESAESCCDLWQFYQLGLLASPWGAFPLVRAIDILAGPEISLANTQLFSKMTTLNLFAIISGVPCSLPTRVLNDLHIIRQDSTSSSFNTEHCSCVILRISARSDWLSKDGQRHGVTEITWD